MFPKDFDGTTPTLNPAPIGHHALLYPSSVATSTTTGRNILYKVDLRFCYTMLLCMYASGADDC